MCLCTHVVLCLLFFWRVHGTMTPGYCTHSQCGLCVCVCEEKERVNALLAFYFCSLLCCLHTLFATSFRSCCSGLCVCVRACAWCVCVCVRVRRNIAHIPTALCNSRSYGMPCLVLALIPSISPRLLPST